jgi:hypothetical protein
VVVADLDPVQWHEVVLESTTVFTVGLDPPLANFAYVENGGGSNQTAMHLDQPLNDVCFKNLLHRRVLLVIAIPTVVPMYSNYNPVIFMAIFIFVTGQPE